MSRFVLLLLAVIGLAAFGEAQEPQKKAQAKKQQDKKPPQKREATSPSDLTTAPGFKVDLIYTADPTTEGSWINMGKDNKGRLIISGQRNQPVVRATLKDGQVEIMEKLDLPISELMGILNAHDSLYVMGAGPGGGYGLYRCRDTKGTGQYDDVKLLKDFKANGEHGAHAIALGKDGKIYVMIGNHTKLPDGLSPKSPFKDYREDLLLPRQWDGNGHAAGILAPGGYVARTDADGKDWELVLGGFRNAYDFTFNADGELFTFDSDMEWDWGMPWYRPTRVNHCTIGSEHGWRSGTGVWPDYYPDNLPPVVNVGVGSPTGVCNGVGAKFPAKYQKAIFVSDWSYGRLIAVHMTPNGSSYNATFENLVAPKGIDGVSPKKPLNISDVVIGDDGAMYFVIGGRNNQSALYRVTYTGTEPTAKADLHDKVGEKERALRHTLEAFHGHTDAKAVATAWPQLNSDDRFLRFAARVAIEFQPVAEWKAKAIAEKQPTAALTALLALARAGDYKDLADLLAALEKLPLSKLSDAQKLDKLRVIQVASTRHGSPPADYARKLTTEIDALFPATNEDFNREAAQVLIFLQSPKVLAKCLKLMANAKTQEDRLHYLFHLRTLPIGFWTLDQRKEYLGYWTKDKGKMAHPAQLTKWFDEAGRPYADGNSYANFLKNFLKEYVTNLSLTERKELEPMIAAIDKAATVTVEAKPRAFVKDWKMDDILPILDKASKGRDFEKGKQAYADAQCAKCHRFSDYGGAVGPELTAVASRFDRRALLESIIEPSKVISEQYQNEEFNTLDGKVIIGRVVDENRTTISVQPDSLDPKRIEIKKSDIDTRKAAKLSPMPAHLVDVLSSDDILDLIAYMESAGRKQHPAFNNKK